jgi:hypothetical protein
MISFEASRQSHESLFDALPRNFIKNLLVTERTLDEAYYPSLSKKALNKRNLDQVVTREYGSSPDAPILTVSEFWIWQLGDFVLSAYSEPGKNPADVDKELARSSGQVDLSLSIPGMEYLHPTKYDPDNREVALHPEDVISRILAYQIDKFGRRQERVIQTATGERLVYSYPSPLDIFEVAVVRVLSDVTEYMDSATSMDFSMQLATTEVMRHEMKAERRFLDNVSDIKSELAMIDEILSQQEEIISTMIVSDNDILAKKGEHTRGLQRNRREKMSSTTSNASADTTPENMDDIRLQRTLSTLEDARSKVQRYRKRVIKIDNDTGRIEKTIQDQLNLKRTYASMHDAHAGVELGRASKYLSTAVIGFTIITIIFAPLAFMASVFALPIDTLNAHKTGDSQSYSTAYLARWFGTCLTTVEIYPS